MDRLTILSPHRDDAVFSMGLALTLLSTRSIELRVLNFFTVSRYAPRSSVTSVEEVSEVRREEDLRALRTISPRIEELSLGLLDAPLRPGIRFDQVTQLPTADLLADEYLLELSSYIQSHCQSDLLAVPLTLGNHVDHISVLRAALRSGHCDLAFYEDLPYATRASQDDFNTKVEWIETQGGMGLKSNLVAIPNAAETKGRLAAIYGSQISPEEAEAIGGFAMVYGGAERLWISSSSNRWKALID